MEKYDVILAGCPTWAGRPSPFMKIFINKAKNIKGKKIAIFGTGMSPINAREQFKEIIRNSLEKKTGMKTFDSFLVLQFKRRKLVDGEQNIDNFVNTVLKL
jgi:flavodoxin